MIYQVNNSADNYRYNIVVGEAMVTVRLLQQVFNIDTADLNEEALLQIKTNLAGSTVQVDGNFYRVAVSYNVSVNDEVLFQSKSIVAFVYDGYSFYTVDALRLYHMYEGIQDFPSAILRKEKGKDPSVIIYFNEKLANASYLVNTNQNVISNTESTQYKGTLIECEQMLKAAL